MDDLTEAEQAALTEWTSVAFDEAVAAGYVTPPWRPTRGAYEQMHGYYASGLTPAEAAQAMFAPRH
ncbi:MAG: hypothetical protein WCA85_25825 [Paraburkholderia sp.]|uniref:hypothetical protein n=1 Tax=Paraburkholderia sp. TaxID=1926495 RepID=UPI003C46EDDD